MTRAEAQAAVAPYIELIPQEPPYPPGQGITREAALALLGEERLAKLTADKIRCGGPAPGYFSPWNILDYLDDATKLA